MWRAREPGSLGFRVRIALASVGLSDDPRPGAWSRSALTGWRSIAAASAFGAVIVVGVGAIRGVGYAAVALLLFGIAIMLLSGRPAELVKRVPDLSNAGLPVASVLTGSIAFDGRSGWEVIGVYGSALVAALLTAALIRHAQVAGKL